tara:strand:+ start:6228 stop:6551 length:324 start_codon:yes stop_codon:yes gene_type:complete
MTRVAAKTDANAKDIDRVLKKLGATIAKTDSVGSGFPDRVVGVNGRNFLLEYKDGAKPPSKRKLNAYQIRWHQSWSGQVAIVTSPEEAVEVVFGIQKVRLKMLSLKE